MVYDVTVVGAGIVGLATALKLRESFPDFRIVVVEKESGPAKHQTGHNSGVIHSGIYYKPGSFKARFCRQGYDKMVKFCEGYGVPHEICGKVIVAVDESELPALRTIHQRGLQNGLSGLRELAPEELREHEPHVKGVAALLVPEAGIVDYKVVAGKLAELCHQRGVEFSWNSSVRTLSLETESVAIETDSRTFHSRLMVNCAGLQSDRLAELTSREALNYRIIPFRGNYYVLRAGREALVKNLIYPVPNPELPFLGVHFTRMIGGGVEAGPNAVLALKRESYGRYQVDIQDMIATLTWPGFYSLAKRYWSVGITEVERTFFKTAFVKAARRLVPEAHDEDFEFHGAGVRAQAVARDGKMIDDFLIIEHPRVLNVGNAPSPAATSSLAIGEYIRERVANMLSNVEGAKDSGTGLY